MDRKRVAEFWAVEIPLVTVPMVFPTLPLPIGLASWGVAALLGAYATNERWLPLLKRREDSRGPKLHQVANPVAPLIAKSEEAAPPIISDPPSPLPAPSSPSAAERLAQFIAEDRMLKRMLEYLEREAGKAEGNFRFIEKWGTGEQPLGFKPGTFGMRTEHYNRVSERLGKYGVSWESPDLEKTKALPDESALKSPQDRERAQQEYYRAWKEYQFFAGALRTAQERLEDLDRLIAAGGTIER